MCPKQQNKSLAQVGATRSNVANSSVNIFFTQYAYMISKGLKLTTLSIVRASLITKLRNHFYKYRMLLFCINFSK